MSRIFITGSADGLGQMAAKLLIADGHQVVLHGRNAARAAEAISAAPGAETVLSGDLSSIKDTIELAEKVNKLGSFDAVIHNAGMGYREVSRGNTVDGLPLLFAVNSLAPYILTSLIHLPQRLIYVSSGLHREGNPSMDDLTWDNKKWSGYQAYADTKLHNVLLAFAAARYQPAIYANALEPGWVATKMGGAGAPDSLTDAPKTQVWLAVSNSAQALVSGKYFYHQKCKAFHPAAANPAVQNGFIEACQRLTGITFPATSHL
ncbi:SDR family NAD(P)-dependent oxidoreductase [Mucilaginibacter sp. CSA2-8R]|uniref:SDR family NAD(P)-dependent oxidoreductase n=1 Tax=Mucilaginibacter sp. CSA2-8R TaxID=3141542 RepID=UPI00315E02AF